MARAAGSSRRWIFTLLFGLWLSEWALHWSEVFGEQGAVVFWLWLAGMVWFVVRSLSATRLPAGLVVALWMVAILAVCLIRALWIGHAAPAEMLEHREQFEEFLRQVPASEHDQFRRLAQVLEILSVPAVAALAGALLAAFELLIVAVSLAIGAGIRAGEARVGVLPRLGLALLQLPTLLFVPAIGVGAIAGLTAVAMTPLVAPPGGFPLEVTAVLASIEDGFWPLLGAGAACWTLGAVHLRCLLMLADGGALTRLALALFALAPGLMVLTDGAGIGWRVVILVWVVLQLALLVAARPQRG